MTKLTLHIGIHRTGTTGLQRNLSANRDRLKELGFVYPFEQKNHQELAWAIYRGDLTGDDVVEKLKPYANDGHIVLSGEDFCIHKSLQWLESVKRSYDVEAVVYLRRQDHWVMSWYNQHLKWPFSRRHSTMTPGEFLACVDDFYWINFERTLGLWAAALGKSKVHVRILEKGQVEDAITDFLAIIGVDKAKIDLDTVPQNDSLPVETLEFVRRAGMIDLKPVKRMAIMNFLRNVVSSPKHSGSTLFTAVERQALLDRFADSNRAVARTWFDRETLFLEAAPDDRKLYVEGTLAANVGFDAVVLKMMQQIGSDQK